MFTQQHSPEPKHPKHPANTTTISTDQDNSLAVVLYLPTQEELDNPDNTFVVEFAVLPCGCHICVTHNTQPPLIWYMNRTAKQPHDFHSYKEYERLQANEPHKYPQIWYRVTNIYLQTKKVNK